MIIKLTLEKPLQVRWVCLVIKCLTVGEVSITLRHRLSCEIRSNSKVPLPAQYHDMCRVDHVKDHPVSPPPDDTRPLSKFSAKLMIENKDELKTNMLVRVSAFVTCTVSHTFSTGYE